ncbi:MAG: Hsp70 family protein [Saprospiraceae bacterium]|nr:Hsp70 family protein [Saprospiraceae bacterium]
MQGTINYGIDLGTTNSAIAIYQNGEVEVFKNPSNLKQTLPSVVAFKRERIIVGDKAKEILSKSPQNVFGGFKRKMGTSDKYFVEATGDFMAPKDLSALVLKELKNFIHTGDNPASIVITIPAAFDTMQSNATKKAGYDAGFKEVVLLQEPIAASLAFANKSGVDFEDSKWLVYDFGGGTFDVALTAIKDEEMKILDHEGDNYLGGSDFDRAVIDQFVIPKMENQGQFSDLESEMKKSSGKYNRLYNKLLYIVEEAKIELTHNETAEIEFDFEDDNGNDYEFYQELDKSTFESIIRPMVQSTVDMIKDIIFRNLLSQEELKCILLIGGTTYIPLVKNMLTDEFGVEVNTTMDPTTAVVVGAAYYAGIKPVSQSNSIVSTTENTLKVKLAYERVVQSESTLIISKAEVPSSGFQYRIIRKDGGFDTGLLPLQETNKCYISVASNVYNVYDYTVFDEHGDKKFSDVIGITHGKFGIDGQPLPDNICLEVDDTEQNTTFLEPIFKKNAILPLRKTITKQVSKTIRKAGDEKLVIKVVEGAIDTIPSSNKLIGIIEISSNMLERDLVRGSDIELTFEITESRDIKVSAYLSLTDQDFEDTFSPSELNVSESELLRETKFFKTNLLEKQKDYEREAEYEKAGAINHLIEEIIELEEDIRALDHDDVSDTKYKIEMRKRTLGKKIHKFYNSSYLTKIIERYYDRKKHASNMLLDPNANESDHAEYHKLIADENTFLNEGNISTIKMKIEHLDSIVKKIYNRDNRQLTMEELTFSYRMYKYHQYKDQVSANKLVQEGDTELERNNFAGLYNVTIQLHNLKEKEKNSSTDVFRNDGTGLK